MNYGLDRRQFMRGSLAASLLAGMTVESQAKSNDDGSKYRLCWGDLHNHNAVGYAKGSLQRRRNTPSQVSLGADDRSSNVEGAFQCRDQAFHNKSVLLIDDVCTTSATMNACAATLKDAGAASVWGLTFSREC